MTDFDNERLKKAVNHFVFRAKNGSSNNTPCTNSDLHNAIDEIAKMMRVFINELENN
jgi:hypothetical protein